MKKILNRLINQESISSEEAKKVRDKISPPTIGKWGQLQEWKELSCEVVGKYLLRH